MTAGAETVRLEIELADPLLDHPVQRPPRGRRQPRAFALAGSCGLRLAAHRVHLCKCHAIDQTGDYGPGASQAVAYLRTSSTTGLDVVWPICLSRGSSAWLACASASFAASAGSACARGRSAKGLVVWPICLSTASSACKRALDGPIPRRVVRFELISSRR